MLGVLAACSDTQPTTPTASASSSVVAGSTSTGSPPDATSSTSWWPDGTATTATGAGPSVCGKPETPFSVSAACGACITPQCCADLDALNSDANVAAYFACLSGPDGDDTGGCYASDDPTTDLAGFQACWDTCIDANPDGAHTVDQFDLCIVASGCDNDMACAGTAFSQGACDSGYTFIAAVCDECMGRNCCTGLGSCVFDSTCDVDFNTCTQDGTKPECTTDAAAGALATCGRDNCATQCGFAAGDGGSGAGGSDGGGGAGGSGGRSGAGGHGAGGHGGG